MSHALLLPFDKKTSMKHIKDAKEELSERHSLQSPFKYDIGQRDEGYDHSRVTENVHMFKHSFKHKLTQKL